MLRRSISADLLAPSLGEKVFRNFTRACVVFAMVALTITTLDLLNVRLVEAATKFIRESHQRVAYLPDQLSAIATAPSAASVEVAQSALKPAIKVTPLPIIGSKIKVEGRRICNHRHRHRHRSQRHAC